MAGVMYFLPDVYTAQLVRGREISRALLASRGLDEVLADRRTIDLTSVFDLTRRGPGDRCGAMLVPLPNSGEAPARMMYEPEFQEWQPGWDPQQLWLGRDRSEAVTPGGLARTQQFRGYDVELADGQVWHVPIVRRPGGSTELPRAIRFGAPGMMELSIEQQYQALWHDLLPALEFLCSEGGRVELEPLVSLAIRVLGVNYRFGLQEQNLLQLVDTTNWQRILEAAIDWPLVEEKIAELQKKTSEESPLPAESMPPGPPAGSPTIAPATPS
ncbi:MAG: hypothetical protein JNG90_19490 [Planctomycetaceae bacterium]|nr:hypothetical protein [Planctomycetaceae bacterium]